MSHFHADTPLALFESFGGKASRTRDGNPNAQPSYMPCVR